VEEERESNILKKPKSFDQFNKSRSKKRRKKWSRWWWLLLETRQIKSPHAPKSVERHVITHGNFDSDNLNGIMVAWPEWSNGGSLT